MCHVTEVSLGSCNQKTVSASIEPLGVFTSLVELYLGVWLGVEGKQIPYAI